MFRVGQKVECIHAGPWRNGYGNEATPQIKTPYTVRAVCAVGDVVGIQLNEIHNPVCEYAEVGRSECWFNARYFRPIVERKTDISIFTRMLKSESVNA